MSDRDDLEVDALVTDRYLDSLLAARERWAAHPSSDPDLAPSVQAVAHALETQLVRVHPSFRFEERLAGDLQAAAARRRRGGSTSRSGPVARIHPRQPDPFGTPQAAPRLAAEHSRLRPFLIGGALTSAAISIAGAYVAWRRGRPPVPPMVRAVRAAHRATVAGGIRARSRQALQGPRTR